MPNPFPYLVHNLWLFFSLSQKYIKDSQISHPGLRSNSHPCFYYSKLDFCNSLLYGIQKYLVCRLQRVQNTAARIVTLTRKYDSITPITFKLHWLPVHSRIIFKLLLLVYKALNGKAPSYISSLLSRRKCSRFLRDSGQELLTVPLTKLKTYGDRAFNIAAPRQWNTLPLSIRTSPSIAIFKRHL